MNHLFEQVVVRCVEGLNSVRIVVPQPRVSLVSVVVGFRVRVVLLSCKQMSSEFSDVLLIRRINFRWSHNNKSPVEGGLCFKEFQLMS